MTDAEKLNLLKQDLQRMTTANDALLTALLQQAASAIKKEGITLVTDDIECDMLQIQYAAYLFRKRGAPDTAIPRYLRYELNNMLISQKGQP